VSESKYEWHHFQFIYFFSGNKNDISTREPQISHIASQTYICPKGLIIDTIYVKLDLYGLARIRDNNCYEVHFRKESKNFGFK